MSPRLYYPTTENAPAPIGSYSQSVLAGNTLYVSGQISLNPKTGKLVTLSIKKETDMVMKNIGAILKESGGNYNNIVKCSIFVNDLENFVKINEVYSKYFPLNPPARETVEVNRLPKDVNVEISCIAIL